jgi:hypothetical protein
LAFEQIHTHARNHVASEEVSVSVYAKSISTTGGCLSIYIPKGAMNKLGWKIGDVIVVDEGSGADIRHLQLTKSEDRRGGFSLSYYSSANKVDGPGNIRIGFTKLKYHTLPDKGHSAEITPFQAFGGRLLMVLPEWIIPV